MTRAVSGGLTYVDVENLPSWWDLPAGRYWGPAGPYARPDRLELPTPGDLVVLHHQAPTWDCNTVLRVVVPLSTVCLIGETAASTSRNLPQVAICLTQLGVDLAPATPTTRSAPADRAVADLLGVPVGTPVERELRLIRELHRPRPLALSDRLRPRRRRSQPAVGNAP